jgi:hypothetical protein
MSRAGALAIEKTGLIITFVARTRVPAPSALLGGGRHYRLRLRLQAHASAGEAINQPKNVVKVAMLQATEASALRA